MLQVERWSGCTPDVPLIDPGRDRCEQGASWLQRVQQYWSGCRRVQAERWERRIRAWQLAVRRHGLTAGSARPHVHGVHLTALHAIAHFRGLRFCRCRHHAWRRQRREPECSESRRENSGDAALMFAHYN